MPKASGLIALLLVIAIILLPFRDSPDKGLALETPLTVSGVSLPINDTAPEDTADDSTQIIAVVIIVVIVIFIICCVVDTESNHTVRR